MKITDDNGDELPLGEVGEVTVRGRRSLKDTSIALKKQRNRFEMAGSIQAMSAVWTQMVSCI